MLYAARPNATPVAAVPTPTSTSVPTATRTATPTPSPQTTNQGVVLNARPTVVPPDFKYVETWPGRIVMFDLAARRATEIATYTTVTAEPGHPAAQLSASADGRTLLVLVLVSPTDRTLFVVRPETGEVRTIMRGPLDRGILSADGSRFAVARHDSDPLLTGLAVGAIADGTTRRLIADDPQLVGSPPIPFAFSRSRASAESCAPRRR